MKLLFENWRAFRKEALNEFISDDAISYQAQGHTTDKVKGPSLPMIAKDKLFDLAFRDTWNYATKRACAWWGPCNEKNITTNHKYDDHFDAHKHILGAALFTQKYNSFIARTMGDAREAWQSGLNPLRLDMMDIENNEIGIALGKKYPNFDEKALDSVVYRIIKRGDFYGHQGAFKKDERK
tara:strand:- start:271 stop:813 length:543 start_codon:yes stop_codon:yes gene_type:complete